MLPDMTLIHPLTNPGHAKEFESYQTTPTSIFEWPVVVSTQSSLNMLPAMTFIYSITNPGHANGFECY